MTPVADSASVATAFSTISASRAADAGSQFIIFSGGVTDG
jgi:hypothetical protein